MTQNYIRFSISTSNRLVKLLFPFYAWQLHPPCTNKNGHILNLMGKTVLHVINSSFCFWPVGELDCAPALKAAQTTFPKMHPLPILFFVHLYTWHRYRSTNCLCSAPLQAWVNKYVCSSLSSSSLLFYLIDEEHPQKKVLLQQIGSLRHSDISSFFQM